MITSDDIQKAVLKLPVDQRVTCLNIKNQNIWIKRPEKVHGFKGWYKRIVTPDFKNELNSLLFLNHENAPAPKVLAYDDDYMALEDSGIALREYIQDHDISIQKKQALLYEAGSALAKLHNMNLAHGRPVLRDMCWDGSKITFIDFERHNGQYASDWQKKQDVLIFIHGLHLRMPPSDAGISKAIEGYLAYDQQSVFQGAMNIANRLTWLLPFLRMIQPVAGRDLGLVVPTLDLLTNKNIEDFLSHSQLQK